MEDTTFDEKQGLEVIRKMILRSKQNYSKEAVPFLIWGWAILLASVLQYLVLTYKWGIKNSYIWIIASVGAFIWTFLYEALRARKKQARTFIDQVMITIWVGFIIMLIIFFSFATSMTEQIPVIIMMMGWGILITGALMKFKPFIIGGIVNFIITVLAFLITTKVLLLLLAASLLCSYLIPGYMLRYSHS